MTSENQMNPDRSSADSGKGLKVIEAFDDREYLTISEASKLVDVSRPTARRVLITLTNLGYAQMLDNRFYLTPKILSLGYSYMSARDSWGNYDNIVA